jgi:hypothetical protein
VGSQRAGSVGFPLLIPPDRAHWPRYITALDVHRYPAGADRVPVARWCGAVRAFAQGAEPLAGNCFPVAGQWLSPSGEYRQPLNITVPDRRGITSAF